MNPNDNRTPVALYLQDAHPIADAIGYVQRAEALGYAAVWQADSRLVREATVPMAAFAATVTAVQGGCAARQAGTVGCAGVAEGA